MRSLSLSSFYVGDYLPLGSSMTSCWPRACWSLSPAQLPFCSPVMFGVARASGGRPRRLSSRGVVLQPSRSSWFFAEGSLLLEGRPFVFSAVLLGAPRGCPSPLLHLPEGLPVLFVLDECPAVCLTFLRRPACRLRGLPCPWSRVLVWSSWWSPTARIWHDR